jgi:hypothetical protein
MRTTKYIYGGIHRWYQSGRQAFKLFNEYKGFWWQAIPRVGCASKIND